MFLQPNEDGSVDISLQMKFNSKEWETLDTALKSDSPLSEEMLRRTIGYVEESIYKPSITEQIMLTWSEYFHIYLAEYKVCLYLCHHHQPGRATARVTTAEH